MEAKDVVRRGNHLKFILGVNANNYIPISTIVSPEYVISGSATFQAKVIAVQTKSSTNNFKCYYLIFIRFSKLRPKEDLTYTAKFSSTVLAIVDKEFTSDDGTWHLVHENNKQQTYFAFDFIIVTDVVPSGSSFSSLHEDTELTDFQLRGEDGSVHMHRAVLAASSPVLRRMLGGTWRETAEGLVDIPGTSRLTLQHLKDYVYIRTLPAVGLEQLLLLSSCYMMPDLEQRCVVKLVSELTAENACELLEFSVKHKVTRLMLAILECIQSGAVQVADMKKHFMRLT